MKTETKTNRETQLVNGFFDTGFDYLGVQYRPLTLREIGILIKANSTYWTGGNEILTIIDILYVTSHPANECLKSISDGTWEEKVSEFSGQFKMLDIIEMGQKINEANVEANAAVVEIKEANSKKK